jgi:hypothetical protein
MPASLILKYPRRGLQQPSLLHVGTRRSHTVVEGRLSTAWQQRLALLIAQVEVVGKVLYGFPQGMLFSISDEPK